MPFITASNMPRARSRSAFEMVPCTGTVTAVGDLVTAGAVFGMAGVVGGGGAGGAERERRPAPPDLWLAQLPAPGFSSSAIRPRLNQKPMLLGVAWFHSWGICEGRNITL